VSGEQRSANRARVYFAARLAAFGDEYKVKLLDVSPLGARIESDLALKVGDEVEFVRADLRLWSRVVWIDGNRAGLEFVEPVRDEEAIKALAKPLGSTFNGRAAFDPLRTLGMLLNYRRSVRSAGL
jgi:hypothetical protein